MRTSVPNISYIPRSKTSAPLRFVSLWQRLKFMLQVQRERYTLADLDAHQLRDIGIDPHQAAVEAERSFFDVPDRRM